MKFIGEFIQHFVSRFRNDIFLEDVSSGTIASGGNLGLDSNNKIVKANEATGDITSITVGDGSGSTHTTSSGDHTTQFLAGEGIDVALNSVSATVKQVTYSAEDASDSNKGVVELATTGEADTGTDTARAVTPAGLKSHVDKRYAYAYLNYEVNTNSFTGTNYEWPAANGGFGSDSFTINTGVARNTAIDGSVSITASANLQQQGWFVPHACKLIGVSGSFRNNGSESNPRDVAIFVGTPDIGTSNTSSYVQRVFAAGDDDGGSSNSKMYKVNTALSTPFDLVAGNILMPAVCNSTGSSTVSMQGNFAIIIAVPIFTI